MAKKVNGGATLWARQTIDSNIFYNKPHVWFKIWFYLVTKTNHKDNKQFKRGSCFLKYEWIMEKTKAKKSELDHAMRWFRKVKMIATQKATRGFILTILKYSVYQDLDTYKATQKATVKAKQKRYKSDTINNNDNNDNNICSSIFTFWNNQKIIVHRDPNKFETHTREVLKKYTKEEILTAINNYSIVLNDDKNILTYRWTLKDFLEKGIDKFLDLDSARKSYQKKNSPETDNRTFEEKVLNDRR